MASNLYETLGVAKDATSEQIRKAYKQKALKTHPDKLPPGLSDEEKELAAEKFREISHACEILTDPERRKEYDVYGIWPPPESLDEDEFNTFFDNIPRHRPTRGGRGFSSPFNAHHRHRSHTHFAFRDPFEFFDTFFRDFDNMFRPPGFGPLDPFGASTSMRPRGMFHDHFSTPTFPSAPPFPSMFMGPLSLEPDIMRGRQGLNSHSESFVSQTINGVTQSTHTRRDQNGNEHVTRKYPDGREIYTINGVEQPARGYLPRTDPEPRQLPSTLPQPHSAFPPGSQRRQRNPTPIQSSRYTAHSFSGQRHNTSPPSLPGDNRRYRAYDQYSDRPPFRDGARDYTAPEAYHNTSNGGSNPSNHRSTHRFFTRS